MEWVAGALAVDVLVGVQNFSPERPDTDVSLMLQFTNGRASVAISNGGAARNGWSCTAGKCLQVFRAIIQLTNLDYIIPDGLQTLSLTVRSATLDGLGLRSMSSTLSCFVVVNSQQMATWPTRGSYNILSYAQSSFPFFDFPSSVTHYANWQDAWPEQLNGTATLFLDVAAFSSAVNVTRLTAGLTKGVYDGAPTPGASLSVLSAPAADVPCKPVNTHVDCWGIKVQPDTRQLPDGDYTLYIRGDSFIATDDPAMVAYNKNRAQQAQAAGGTMSSVVVVSVRLRNTQPPEPPPGPEPPAPPLPLPPKPNPPPGVVFFNGSQTLPPPTQVFFTPSNCSGWLEKRVYMEAQAWFTRPGNDVNFNATHLHIGACVPHKQMIAGKLPLDLLIQKHNFLDSYATSEVQLTATFTWIGGKVTLEIFAAGASKDWQDCAPFSVVCKKVFTVWIDTRPENNAWAVPDGINGLTISAKTRFNDGKQERGLSAEFRAFVAVANNKATDIGSRSFAIPQLSQVGFPWAYTHAELNPDLPVTHVTGTWNFWSRHTSETVNANVTGVFVAVDPVFHGNVTKGKVVLEAASADAPDACKPFQAHINCFPTHSVDTTNLADGAHKLFVRTDSFVAEDDPVLTAINSKLPPESQIAGGTFSAVTLVIFTTRNAATGISSAADDGSAEPDDAGASLDWASFTTPGAYGGGNSSSGGDGGADAGNGTSSDGSGGAAVAAPLFIPPDELQVPLDDLDGSLLSIAAEQVVPAFATLVDASYG